MRCFPRLRTLFRRYAVIWIQHSYTRLAYKTSAGAPNERYKDVSPRPALTRKAGTKLASHSSKETFLMDLDKRHYPQPLEGLIIRPQPYTSRISCHSESIAKVL
ncbi:hypothetical protein J6590_070074 [Homalodisca vitripennis]|nr:hypothetical protein J6590_070074 [Homalodisca vitripennis]